MTEQRYRANTHPYERGVRAWRVSSIGIPDWVRERLWMANPPPFGFHDWLVEMPSGRGVWTYTDARFRECYAPEPIGASNG